MSFRVSLFLMGLAVSCVANAAGVYTWKDAQGVTHFGDRPPADIQAKEMVGIDGGGRSSRGSDAHTDGKQASSQTGQNAQNGSTVSIDDLQGTWCEYEIEALGIVDSKVAEKIVWAFSGDSLNYKDLETGIEVSSKVRIEEGRIVTDQAMMGNHTIKSLSGSRLELGSSTVYRLRRGGC